MPQIDLTGLPAAACTSALDSPLRRLVVTTMFERGLTLEDVAVRGGLSVATVAALRSGGRGKRPRRDTLERLARGLGIDLEEVLAVAAPPQEDAAEQRLLRAFRRLSDDDKEAVLAQLACLAAGSEAPAVRV